MNTLLRKVLSLLLCVVLLASTLFGAMAVSVATVEPTAMAEATVDTNATATPEPTVTPEATAIAETPVTAEPDVTMSPEPVTTATLETTATPVATVPSVDPTEPFLELSFYYIVANEEATVVGYTDAEVTELILPRVLGGVKVTAIGARAFTTLEKLERIALHEDVKAIAHDAFPPSLRLIAGPAGSFAQAWALEHGIAFEADATGATASPKPAETEAPTLPAESPEVPVEELPSAIELLDDTGTLDRFESEPCLLVAAQSGSTIAVTLSGPEGAEFWEIYGAVGDGEFALLATQSDASYGFAGSTTLGQTYRFKARAGKSGELYTAYSETVSVTLRPDVTVLNEPAWVDVDVLGLTWSSVSGATGYDVLLLDKDGHLIEVLPATVTGTNATVTNLPVEEVWLAVRAYVLFEGKRVVSNPSNARVMTVAYNPAPVFKSITVSQFGSVSLSWLKLPGVIEYVLSSSPYPDGSHANLYPNFNPDRTETVCSLDINGGAYYFTLQAKFPSGVTRSVAKVWMPLSAPTIVSKVYDRDEENRERCQLTWKPLSGAAGYSYGYRISGTQIYHVCGTTTADVCTATYWLDELPVSKGIQLVLYGFQYDDNGTLVKGRYENYIKHYTFASVPQIDILTQIGPREVFIKPKDTGGETNFMVYYRYGTNPSTFSDYMLNQGRCIDLPDSFSTGIQIEFWICAKSVSGVLSEESEHRTLTLSPNYGPVITYAGYTDGKSYVYWNPVPGATGYVL